MGHLGVFEQSENKTVKRDLQWMTWETASPLGGQGHTFLQDKQTPVEAADLKPSWHKKAASQAQ